MDAACSRQGGNIARVAYCFPEQLARAGFVWHPLLRTACFYQHVGGGLLKCHAALRTVSRSRLDNGHGFAKKHTTEEETGD